VDNILRPLLFKGRVEMHTLLVFFSILGGIALLRYIRRHSGTISLRDRADVF
jgi:hypothetical protein